MNPLRKHNCVLSVKEEQCSTSAHGQAPAVVGFANRGVWSWVARRTGHYNTDARGRLPHVRRRATRRVRGVARVVCARRQDPAVVGVAGRG